MASISRARRDDSQNPYVLLSYARSYMTLRRFDEAADKFRAAMVLSPPETIKESHGGGLLLHLVGSEALAGQLDSARQHLNDFQKANPDLRSIETALAKTEISQDSPQLRDILVDGLHKAGLPN